MHRKELNFGYVTLKSQTYKMKYRICVAKEPLLYASPFYFSDLLV